MKKLELTYLQRSSLEAVIVHWEENLEKAKAGKLYNYSSAYCQLCADFFNEQKENECSDCPVYMITDISRCENTPWVDVSNASMLFDNYKDSPKRAAEFVRATEQELFFLQNILKNSTLKEG